MITLRIRFEIFLIVVLLFNGCVPVVNAENASSRTNLTNPALNSTVYPAEPFITIDPIRDHIAGDIFIIHGTTNLPPSDKKSFLLSISSTGVTPGGDRGSFYYATNLLILSGVNESNQWSENITDIGIPVPGEYFVYVSSIDSNISVYQLFNVIPPLSPPLPEKSFITVDPIGNHTIGDVFIIHGTTNLPVSTNKSLLLSIIPTWKDPDRYSGFVYSKYVAILPGENETNQWSENITDIDWRPNNEYFIKISSLYKQDFSMNNMPETTQVFTILPANTSPTLVPSTLSQVQLTINLTKIPPTTQSAPISIILPFVMLVIIVILKTIPRKKRD